MHETLHLLAQNAIGRVERCDCGQIHLTVGALTLRLTPDMIGQLSHLLSGASLSVAFNHHHDAPLA